MDVELPWGPGTASGVGSLPYTDPMEATRVVLGELPDLPHLPELPTRGPGADMVGRSCALLVGLGVDLQPAGWRLTAAPGRDQRRARSTLGQDLDALEELTQGYTGPLKVQVAGPWTLAASVELPRGGRVLGDHGARRDLAQSLAEGLTEHLADVRRRVPGASLVLQVDEPSLPAVLSGAIPTPSGFSRYRSVDNPEAEALVREVVSAADAQGAIPIVHCCGSEVPFELLVRGGARGLSFDMARVRDADVEALAAAVEQGVTLFVGAVPAVPGPEDASTKPSREGPRGPSDLEVTRAVLRFWRTLGFPEETAARGCVVTPSCGLAGAEPAWTRTVLTLVRKVAAHLDDRPDSATAPDDERS
ncbi:methionine synthase [Thermasporomyces composti]|uniref:Cobalamin-independent methionine synthase catalytic subunit n=1 Tax=Thermasporomyces composti TaxID=696763 RepID=A0A3D9V0I7_THECX|nr:cobalamin-independent methionine synthase catalytic subunit [Thermasporomyces composti]